MLKVNDKNQDETWRTYFIKEDCYVLSLYKNEPMKLSEKKWESIGDLSKDLEC